MPIPERAAASLFLIPLSLVLVGLLLFTALLFGQRELTVLALLLFGIAAGAKLWSRWSLEGIECRLGIDRRRLFPGETLQLTVTAENRKPLPVLLRAGAPIGGLAHGPSAAREVTAETSLLWYEQADFRWELTALRRGVHRIGPLGLISGDLFGFFPRFRKRDDGLDVVVYPRLVPLEPPVLPRRDFFGIPGNESPVQDPIYILGTRDYQHGRPAKHIHWKATARHGRLQEKVFEPSAQEKILLVVDVGPFARLGAQEPFERLLETAASVAVRLAVRGCSMGLVTNGRMAGDGPAVLSVTRNPQQLTALLEALARVQMAPARELVDTLRLGRLPWGITCLYFSLENDPSAQAAREYFAQRRIPFLFVAGHTLADPPEPGRDGSPEGPEGGVLPAGEGRE
jgi:uncharacterized protein (DUF58 family)